MRICYLCFTPQNDNDLANFARQNYLTKITGILPL